MLLKSADESSGICSSLPDPSSPPFRGQVVGRVGLDCHQPDQLIFGNHQTLSSTPVPGQEKGKISRKRVIKWATLEEMVVQAAQGGMAEEGQLNTLSAVNGII